MSGYLTWLADELRGAGLKVVEYDGWERRARGSGGFDGSRPWCVMWHHTASTASAADDAQYEIYGSSDAPIANLNVARDGTIHLLAAGATNTNGKGDGLQTSSGWIPADSMNTHAVGMEICNNGVGEPYPRAQLDAAFAASNAINARLGLPPTDIGTHYDYAPTRKIDPATATAAAAGGLSVSSVSSSGSWSLDDLRAECSRRSTHNGDDEMTPAQEKKLDQVIDMLHDQDSRSLGRYNTWTNRWEGMLLPRHDNIVTRQNKIIAMLNEEPTAQLDAELVDIDDDE